MSVTQPQLQKDELQDSWVDVHYQNNGTNSNSPKKVEPENVGLYTPLNIEKLLKDAQRESTSTSRETSARGSPKSLHSPTNELATSQDGRQEVGTDWIWDWSSGPERNPSGDLSFKFRHPVKRHRYSVRNTGVLKSHSVFTLENLPTLLLSHAASFVFGAAVMLIYLKKYCRLN